MNSVDENIRNAFIAVHKTHKNVNQLMEYCRTIANEKTNYKTVNGKFLKWQIGTAITTDGVSMILFCCSKEKRIKSSRMSGVMVQYMPWKSCFIMMNTSSSCPPFTCQNSNMKISLRGKRDIHLQIISIFIIHKRDRIYGYPNEWRRNILSYSKNERNSRSILRRSQKR
jgi:hypothetical protein